MSKLFSFFGFSARLFIGLLAYAFSKQFRAMVQYKMAQMARGANDKVTSGEEVTAVLTTPQGKQVI